MPATPRGTRAAIELGSGIAASDELTVTLTTQGWLRPRGGLWKLQQQVVVHSPMLLLHGETLRVKQLVFSQDGNGGTRTQPTLCNELAMGKNGIIGRIKNPGPETPQPISLPSSMF